MDFPRLGGFRIRCGSGSGSLLASAIQEDVDARLLEEAHAMN
jgi:hypothetical protein